MKQCRRRILLAVEPGVLEGALAKLLAAHVDDEIMQLGRHHLTPLSGRYDVAVISIDLPAGVEADVVITLPDSRGSAGIGSVRNGSTLDEVSISNAERVIELLDEYASRQPRQQPN